MNDSIPFSISLEEALARSLASQAVLDALLRQLFALGVLSTVDVRDVAETAASTLRGTVRLDNAHGDIGRRAEGLIAEYLELYPQEH